MKMGNDNGLIVIQKKIASKKRTKTSKKNHSKGCDVEEGERKREEKIRIGFSFCFVFPFTPFFSYVFDDTKKSNENGFNPPPPFQIIIKTVLHTIHSGV